MVSTLYFLLPSQVAVRCFKRHGKFYYSDVNNGAWKWASIGYAKGSKLKALGAHTNDGLHYLYVSTDVTRQASQTLGDLTMSAETEGGMTFVFKRPPHGSYIYAGVTPTRYGASVELGSANNAGQDWGTSASAKLTICKRNGNCTALTMSLVKKRNSVSK